MGLSLTYINTNSNFYKCYNKFQMRLLFLLILYIVTYILPILSIATFVENLAVQLIAAILFIIVYNLLTSSFYEESIKKYLIDKNEKVKNDLTSRK